MTILALDTTSARASLALRRNGITVAASTLDSTDGFAHLVFPAIEDLLRQAAIPLAAIDCFAAAAGPGSFTGVRVGLATAKGLAAALGKPAVGVSNLRALAALGHGPRRAPVIDARRGEVYAALYDEHLRLLAPETVLPLAVWKAQIGAEPVEWIFQEETLAQGANLAEAVALCADLDGETGWQNPDELDANYVRRSDAELFWREG